MLVSLRSFSAFFLLWYFLIQRNTNRIRISSVAISKIVSMDNQDMLLDDRFKSPRLTVSSFGPVCLCGKGDFDLHMMINKFKSSKILSIR